MANNPKKVLARGWTFEIKSGAIWIEIKGINSFDPSPDAKDVETTDFDSNGWNESMIAGRGLKLSLEGFYLEDVSDGSRDPGQSAVETQSSLIGPSSVATYRMTSPGGRVKTFDATANVTSAGGGTNDAAKWKAELAVTGQPIDSSATLIAVVVLPDAPTQSKTASTALQFSAIGVYDNGSSRDITSLATWSSGTPATATIGAATGMATLVAAGSTVITATLGGKSDTSTLTVTA
jgi:hypothetical protein